VDVNAEIGKMLPPSTRISCSAGAGRILHVDPNGKATVVVGGLSFPTAMTMGPDGALYVSNLGFAGAGAGQIVRVAIR
jgi:hypothetical protein